MKKLKNTILKVLFLSIFLSVNVPSLFGMQQFSSWFGKQDNKRDFISELPSELSLMIFEYLDSADLGKAACVSKNWNCLASDWQVWKHKVEDNLPDDFSNILPNQQNGHAYDAANWKNVYLKDDWQKLNDKITQIKQKLEQNTATQSDLDNLDYLRNAKIMFIAIAYTNKNKDINWNDFNWNQFSQDSLFAYALKVLKSNEDKFAKIRNKLLNNLDCNNKPNINLSNLTNAELAGLFPLILIKNENTNLIKLNINYSKLTSLPESIGDLTNLIKLNLNENQLKSLPKSIGNLTNLIRLSLISNQLTSLPESIGDLTNLIRLYLISNQLKSLPESIGNLKKLVGLRLESNQLESLPESIGNLKKLVGLCLESNRLTSLPESIGNLTNLIELNLCANQLKYLPESIGNLTNLIELNLSANQFKYLPESIGNLINLRRLYLYGYIYGHRKAVKITKKNALEDIRNLTISGNYELVDPSELTTEIMENDNSMQIDEDRYWFCQIL